MSPLGDVVCDCSATSRPSSLCQLIMIHNHCPNSVIMESAAPPLTILSVRRRRYRWHPATKKPRGKRGSFGSVTYR
jgi:hypothetical protein